MSTHEHAERPGALELGYYLNKLRRALRFFEEPAAHDTRPRLSGEWLRQLPVLHTRS